MNTQIYPIPSGLLPPDEEFNAGNAGNAGNDENSENAIARLSYRHEAIMNWLVMNPHKKLRDCAEELNYSQTWLSQLIHSDIFQAKLQEKHADVFTEIAQNIPVKMRGLADLAIEKVTEVLERSEEPALIVDIFDKTLSRLGYGPGKSGQNMAPSAQVNVFTISKDDLAQARGAISTPRPAGVEVSIATNSNSNFESGVFEHTPSISWTEDSARAETPGR